MRNKPLKSKKGNLKNENYNFNLDIMFTDEKIISMYYF